MSRFDSHLYATAAYDMTAEDRAEEARERDAELLASYRAELIRLPMLMAEVCLSDTEARAASTALKDGDAVEFARIWEVAIGNYADEQIEGRSERDGFSEWESAMQLCIVYAEPQQAAA